MLRVEKYFVKIFVDEKIILHCMLERDMCFTVRPQSGCKGEMFGRNDFVGTVLNFEFLRTPKCVG
jgi:hypothetical protein